MLSSTPHKQLWYPIPVILLITVIGRDQWIEINYGPTYYVFTLIHIGTVLSLLLFINGLIYYLLRQKTKNTTLTRIQVCMTIMVSVTLFLFGLIWKDWVIVNHIRMGFVNDAIYILIFLGIISQGLMVIWVGRYTMNWLLSI